MDARKFRRALVFGGALIAGLAATAVVASAQARYPNQTIKIVVGFAAGGGNDIIARIIGQKLQEGLGTTVIIENRPGAGGKIAAEAVMTAPPDGYTLLVGAAGAMSIIPAISVKQPYHGTKDFAPISMVAAFPLILVVQASHPAKNVKDLVAWMKANPDKSNYATSSPAFTLATELFKLKTGAPGTAIPYKSSGESLVSVLGEQSLLTIADPPPTTPLVKNGQVRALAVLATTRSDELPDVPTMTEAGVPDVNVSLWSGLFAPAHTPPDIVARLEGEIVKIMQMPDVKEKLTAFSYELAPNMPEEFAALIKTEMDKWAKVIRDAKIPKVE